MIGGSNAPPAVVFECVGVPGSLQLAIEYATFDARIVVVGLCMATDTITPAKAITKELDMSFAFVYRKRHFEIVVDLIDRGRIDPRGMVTGCVGFDAFPAAFEAFFPLSEGGAEALLEQFSRRPMTDKDRENSLARFPDRRGQIAIRLVRSLRNPK